MFSQLETILYIVAGILVFLFFVIFIFLIFYKKKRKKLFKENEVDYSHFDRKDASDYVKLDDIKDSMNIVENGTRFVGAIKCQGYEFYSAPVENQAMTAVGFRGFISTINRPVTYRQYSKAVDMDGTKKMYKEAYDTAEKQLFNILEDIKDLKSILRKKGTVLAEQQKELYEKELEEKEKYKTVLQNRLIHIADNIEYIEYVSSIEVTSDITETWLFDWKYNPWEYSVELTSEEIHKQAIKKLNEEAQNKKNALSRCNVRAKRCSTADLIEMSRRYSAPLSADRYKTRDIIHNSSFFDDIVTSSSVNDIVQNAKEEVLERDVHSFSDIIQNLPFTDPPTQATDGIVEDANEDTAYCSSENSHSDGSRAGGIIEHSPRSVRRNAVRRVTEEKQAEQKQEKSVQTKNRKCGPVPARRIRAVKGGNLSVSQK